MIWTNMDTLIGPVSVLPEHLPLSAKELYLDASSETRSRAIELKSEVRRSEFLRGRWLFRAVYKTTLDLGRSPDGDPIWPQGSCGSISHKQGTVALSVQSDSLWRSIGIDLERVAVNPGIRGKIMTEKEYELISQVTAENEQVAAVFAAKEALFKAVFPVGRTHFWFDGAVVESAKTVNGMIYVSLRLLQDFGVSKVIGRPLSGLVEVEIQKVRVSSDGSDPLFLAVCGILR
ncbi:MAG: 4'-phosphopantetheinyl transferase superfamily protein [Proteobacteria bacterium]|nr:4'-phosphopantetheinyl transferase superfamily protein [Pseudomonadota bacterium]